MKNIFVVVGESGSGKSTLAKGYCSTHGDVELLVTTTSRPPRVGEIDRQDYNFLSHEEFLEMVKLKRFVEHTQFRDWHYGLTKDTIYSCKSNNMLVVLNPYGLENLIKILDRREYNIIPIYIYASEKIRLIRSLTRGSDVNEVLRRLNADRMDFEKVPHIVLENNGYIIRNDKLLEFAVEQLTKTIESCIEDSNDGWN